MADIKGIPTMVVICQVGNFPVMFGPFQTRPDARLWLEKTHTIRTGCEEHSNESHRVCQHLCIHSHTLELVQKP